MPNPDSLGASGRYIEIDLVTGPPTFPLYFQPLFVAAFPGDPTFAGQAVSRAIVALGAGGTISLISTQGGVVIEDWPMSLGEVNSAQAVGVNAAPTGITSIKVFA